MSVGVDIMYMFARTDSERVEFERARYFRFLVGVRGLVVPREDWDLVSGSFRDADIPLFLARDYYRDGALHNVGLDDQYTRAAMLYVHRCLGHRVVGRDIMKYPRLCVLWARRVLEDRWREAEDAICSDPYAARLYSEFVVGGRLPSAMHNRLVMESFVVRVPVLDPYFRACTK